MKLSNVSSLVVVDGGGNYTIGVVTELCFLTRVLQPRLDVSALRVTDIMSRSVVSVSTSSTLSTILSVMLDTNCRHVPVADNLTASQLDVTPIGKAGKIQGVIFVRDVLAQLLGLDFLDDSPVSIILPAHDTTSVFRLPNGYGGDRGALPSPPSVWVNLDDPVMVAVDLLVRYHANFLMVRNTSQEPVGIVTPRDCLENWFLAGNSEGAILVDVILQNLKPASEDDSIRAVAELMYDEGIC